MPVVTTAEYVVMFQIYGKVRHPAGRIRTRSSQSFMSGSGRTRRAWPGDPFRRSQCFVKGSFTMLVKVFPIKLRNGLQDKVEEVVREFAPKGPGTEDGTLSFRVYRDPAKPDYLLFVEHFADQAAYDAHTGSDAYKELIAGRFAGLITEFVEIDHELLVGI